MNIDEGTISGSEPSVGKNWPGVPLLCVDTQKTLSAPCLVCFGAVVVQNDARCTQGVLMLSLVGESVQRLNKPA